MEDRFAGDSPFKSAIPLVVDDLSKAVCRSTGGNCASVVNESVYLPYNLTAIWL